MSPSASQEPDSIPPEPVATIFRLIILASAVDPPSTSSGLLRDKLMRKLWFALYTTAYVVSNATKMKKNILEQIDIQETMAEHYLWRNAEFARSTVPLRPEVDTIPISRLESRAERKQAEFQPLEAKTNQVDELLQKVKRDEELGPEDKRLIKECQVWAEQEKGLFHYLEDELTAAGFTRAKFDLIFQRRVRADW